MVLGIDYRLYVGAHYAGAPAAGGHRARIRIGQRDLSVFGCLHLFAKPIQCLYVLLDRGDLVLEMGNPAGQHCSGVAVSAIDMPKNSRQRPLRL